MCAFDKNPKMPIDVINISITTAGTKYNFINARHWFQYSCSHTVATIFAASSTEPIMIIGIAAAANMAASPAIE